MSDTTAKSAISDIPSDTSVVVKSKTQLPRNEGVKSAHQQRMDAVKRRTPEERALARARNIARRSERGAKAALAVLQRLATSSADEEIQRDAAKALLDYYSKQPKAASGGLPKVRDIRIASVTVNRPTPQRGSDGWLRGAGGHVSEATKDRTSQPTVIDATTSNRSAIAGSGVSTPHLSTQSAAGPAGGAGNDVIGQIKVIDTIAEEAEG